MSVWVTCFAINLWLLTCPAKGIARFRFGGQADVIVRDPQPGLAPFFAIQLSVPCADGRGSNPGT